ncbi:NADPH-dependent F420 reductase [Arthrobacter sp. TMN-37]
MKISVLGTGNVGSALADGFRAAGHDVVLGARNPEGKEGFATKVVGLQEAIASGEVVLSALPGHAAQDILGPFGDALAGKLLIDVGNAFTPAFELAYPDASLGAALQAQFPDTRVVKTLNTMPVAAMTGAQSRAAETTVFLSGNDSAAKETVGGLLSDLGWNREHQVDLGDISTARSAEHYIFLSFNLMSSLNAQSFNIKVVA